MNLKFVFLLFCFNFANSAITPETTTTLVTKAPTTIAPSTIIIKTPAKLLCEFDLLILYTCNSPSNGTINLVTAENEAIQVSGTHVRGRSDADVELVEISKPHVMNFVPTKVFETFKKLTRFQMSNVNLTTLTKNAFMNCSFLEQIEIVGNNFSLVPASFAESCTKLHGLTLRNNNIKSIDKDAFKGLGNLKMLSMDGNDIASLDSLTFFYTPNVQDIYFANTKLKKIHSDTFAQLSLLRLDLSGNEIESLPALKFRNVSSLLFIYLNNNKINEINPAMILSYPASRQQFSLNLRQNLCVDGDYNKTAQLNIGLQKCFDNWNQQNQTTTKTTTVVTTTTTLVLTTPIPTTTFLTTTTVSSNLPCATCTFHKVCRYFLDHDEVYSCVLNDVDLVLTVISGDHETFKGQTFTDADVKAVYLKNSTLSNVPSIIFSKFPNIEFLSIPQTQMTIINDNTFKLCGEKLKRLDVSGNQITKITKNSLIKCQQLETIDLSGNLIEDLDSEMFKVDPKLRHVILNRKSFLE